VANDFLDKMAGTEVAPAQDAGGGFLDRMAGLETEAPKEEKPSYFSRFLKGETSDITDYLKKNPLVSPESNLKGVLESAVSLMTGIPAFMGGIAADTAVTLATGDVDKGEAAAALVNKGMYQPETELGKKVVSGVGEVIDPAFKMLRHMGEQQGKGLDSPVAGRVIGNILQVAAPGLLKPAIGAIRGELPAITRTPAEELKTVLEKPKAEAVAEVQPKRFILDEMIAEEKVPEVKAEEVKPAAEVARPRAKYIQSREDLIGQGYSESQVEYLLNKQKDRLEGFSDTGSWTPEEVAAKAGKLERLGGDEPVIVYRAVPKGKGINEGDYVFVDKEEANAFLEEHGRTRGQPEIATIEVKKSDLVIPDKASPTEMIYAPLSKTETTGKLKQSVIPGASEAETKGLPELAAELKAAQARGSFSLEKKGQTPPPAEFSFAKDIEARFQAAKGKPQEGPLTRFKDFMTDIGHKMSRPYEHLPKTGEYAEAQFALKRLEKQKEVTNSRAIIDKADELAGLDKPKYDLFTRKVMLDDLVGEAEKGRKLPFGFTPETVKAEHAKISKGAESSPEVQAAIAKRKANWDRMKAEYVGAMNDIGFDVSERFTNENYFRHQVIEYANAKKVMGTGKTLKTPANRGFLKKRGGSELDINTDYLEAEFEVYGQMMHDIEIARTISRIDKNYNIADRVRKEAKAKGLDDWTQAIPEDYTTWQPREGNTFYMADTIPAKLAEKLYSGELAEIGITEADLKKAMIQGGKRRQFVIKQELADTLDNLGKKADTGLIEQADKTILKGWKVWQLVSPRRLIKYNLRNITGDADAAFVGNPSGFSKVPKAVHDLWDVYVNKKPMSHEMEQWFDRGGMQANLQAAEISALKDLWVFDRLYQKNKTLADLPKEAWEKYWKTARISTDFREGIMRYANFLDYMEQVKKDPKGKPKNFGASIPDEIMGLKDPVDRAYWLSNDLLGAYDRVSVFGQSMRDHIFPFWSWKEVNMKRYKQFVQNAINDGNLAETVGRKALGAAVKSPMVAAKVGGFLVKATAFWSMLQTWNHLVYPEEEKALSAEMKKKPHIVLGRDEKGDIVYFNRIGALGDILEWFGLDAAPKQVDKWLSGKATLKEVAQEMGESAAKAPVNVFASGSVPFAKLALETATRRSTFPDVTKPSTIRDRGLYLARSFGLENEYIGLAGKPSKGYIKSVPKMVAYTVDPLEGAYRDVFELKSEFQKKLGKSAEGFWLTPKGDALYNLKLSLRYGDTEAFAKYASEYAQLGGTKEGMLSSIQRMEPLGGMSADEKKVFISSLKPDEKEKVIKAYEFYKTVMLGEKAAKEKRNK